MGGGAERGRNVKEKFGVGEGGALMFRSGEEWRALKNSGLCQVEGIYRFNLGRVGKGKPGVSLPPPEVS